MNPRVLILIGVVLLLVAVVGFVVLPGFLQSDQPPPPTSESGVQVTEDSGPDTIQQIDTPTPMPMVNIVIAVQELPRGFRIPANAVAVRPWPADSAPFNGITNVEDVVNKIARTDIFREQPILSNMLVDDFQNLANDLGRVGSDAAAILPQNLVAVAMPIDRLTSVAYAIQDGDRVDVIVSMLFVDVDEDFQTISPNEYVLVVTTDDGQRTLSEATEGRLAQTQLGEAIIKPSERQRPRLLTQRTIQDALVVHVGEFPSDGRFLAVPPTPTPLPDDTEEEEDEADGPPPPTPLPPRPDIVTLGVTPQDAVLLVWAVEARLPLTLALRSATDNSQLPTEPVTLDFFMQEYRITVPGKREYTIEPALRSIRQLDLNSTTLSLDPGGGGGANGE